jgi:ankyrin repeat protein
MNAASRGEIDMIEFLVKNGADIHAREDEALLIAASHLWRPAGQYNVHLEIVKFLASKYDSCQEVADILKISEEELEKKYDRDCANLTKGISGGGGHSRRNGNNRNNSLKSKSKNKRFNKLKKGGGLEEDRLLIENARQGNLEGVRHALELGAIDHAYGGALIIAALNGHLEIVKFLLENDHYINRHQDLALKNAAHHGHLEIVKFLVKNGANIHTDEDEVDPLGSAAVRGHLEIVKFLLENGADIHASKDRSLINAALSGHLEIVKFLVENGADIDARNDQALVSAAIRGHLEIVKFLASKYDSCQEVADILEISEEELEQKYDMDCSNLTKGISGGRMSILMNNNNSRTNIYNHKSKSKFTKGGRK